MRQILSRLSGVKGCILDFRTSGGGNSLNGMTVLAPFVPDETIRTAEGGSSLYQMQDSRLMTLAWFQSMDSDTLYRLGLDGQTLQNMRGSSIRMRRLIPAARCWRDGTVKKRAPFPLCLSWIRGTTPSRGFSSAVRR